MAIELRRGSLPDNRDFLRFKFKNGTDDSFRTIHVFGHKGDIPLTEFIYRVEVFVLFNPSQSRDLDRRISAEGRDWL
jgi:lysosomal acid phosphatase